MKSPLQSRFTPGSLELLSSYSREKLAGDIRAAVTVGFIALPLALTTIHVSKKEMAHSCIRALNHTKANLNKLGLLLSVGTSLIIRDSTAPPPSESATSGRARPDSRVSVAV